MTIIMGAHFRDDKLVTIAEPKTTYFDLSKDAGNNVKNEIHSILKSFS